MRAGVNERNIPKDAKGEQRVFDKITPDGTRSPSVNPRRESMVDSQGRLTWTDHSITVTDTLRTAGAHTHQTTSNFTHYPKLKPSSSQANVFIIAATTHVPLHEYMYPWVRLSKLSQRWRRLCQESPSHAHFDHTRTTNRKLLTLTVLHHLHLFSNRLQI